MPHDAGKLLQDLIESAQIILRYVGGADAESYLADRQRKDAVERRFIIIGEARGRLKRNDPGLATRIENTEAIRSFRNVIVHQYDGIDDLAVFGIIRDDLPSFIKQVEVLFDAYDPGRPRA